MKCRSIYNIFILNSDGKGGGVLCEKCIFVDFFEIFILSSLPGVEGGVRGD